MKQKSTRFLVQSALIAAMYAALTYAAMLADLAYGPVQLRFSEAMTILAAYTPAAIPGLAVGCFLGNLASPMPLDLVFGTGATLLAAVCSYLARNLRLKSLPILSLFFPVLFNALLVGAEITFFLPGEIGAAAYLFNAAWVGLGELTVCCAGGIPLSLALNQPALKKLLK